MNWLWAYFRRKTMQSIIAGVHDAVASTDGSSELSDEQAGIALRAIIGMGEGTAGEQGRAPPPQALQAPGPNGAVAVPEPARRGPGRPRKFQEPEA